LDKTLIFLIAIDAFLTTERAIVIITEFANKERSLIKSEKNILNDRFIFSYFFFLNFF
jgi:hypothetical protein